MAGFWSRLKDRFTAGGLQSAASILYIGDVGDLDAGVVVDRETAMEIASVFACIRILSEDVGQIPLPVYRNTKEGPVKAFRERAYKAFKYGPNAWQTVQDWQEQIMLHLLTCGDYFAEIARVNGAFDELYPQEKPDTVRPFVKSGRRWFEVTDAKSKSTRTYNDTQMFHLHTPSVDGYAGRDMCDTHRQTLSLAKALYRYGAKFFANGGQPRGILILPPGQSQADCTAVAALFKQKYGGSNSHEVAAYKNGTDWKQISVDPEKSQALESRNQVNKEIAALYRVPLWRLYGETPPTPDARRAYWMDTVRPYLVRIAVGVNKWLIGPGEAMYAEHNVAALLQADIKTRYEAYALGITNRILCPNEARRMENLRTYAGGDEFLNPNVISTEDTKRLADKGQKGAGDEK